MSAHHPSSELLEKFAAAEIDGSTASVISAHVEHCGICQKSTNFFEQRLSAKVFDTAQQLSSTENDEAWQKISLRLGPMNLGSSGKISHSFSLAQNEIQIDGLKFEIPRALHRLAIKPLKWISFGKGGKICKLGDEKGKSLFLIYLASKQEVPLHSHEGTEHSYVISGSYSADGLTFETGDFSSSTNEVTHSPKAGSEAGCLLLSSVENRLNFLHGLLKPFNGLLWWVLNLHMKRIK